MTTTKNLTPRKKNSNTQAAAAKMTSTTQIKTKSDGISMQQRSGLFCLGFGLKWSGSCFI